MSVRRICCPLRRQGLSLYDAAFVAVSPTSSFSKTRMLLRCMLDFHHKQEAKEATKTGLDVVGP